jgi:hypothetical protein
MAPVKPDSDNRMSARKNLCIVFLHSDGREFQSRMGITGTDQFRLQTPRTAAVSEAETLANAAKFTAPHLEWLALRSQFVDTNNRLISQHYFMIG